MDLTMYLLAINWSAFFANVGQFILAFSILVVLHEMGHLAGQVNHDVDIAHGGSDRAGVADVAAKHLERSAARCAQPFQVALAAGPRHIVVDNDVVALG